MTHLEVFLKISTGFLSFYLGALGASVPFFGFDAFKFVTASLAIVYWGIVSIFCGVCIFTRIGWLD